MLNLPNLDEKLKPVKLSYRFYWLAWKELIKPTRRDNTGSTTVTATIQLHILEFLSHQLFDFCQALVSSSKEWDYNKNKLLSNEKQSRVLVYEQIKIKIKI